MNKKRIGDEQKLQKFEKFLKVTLILACFLILISVILFITAQIGKLKNWDVNICEKFRKIAIILIRNGVTIFFYYSIAMYMVCDLKKLKDKNRPKAKKLDSIILGMFITFIIFQIGYTIGNLIEAII